MRLFPATENAQCLNNPNFLVSTFKGFSQHEIRALEEDLVLLRRVRLGRDGADSRMQYGTGF
jgi:hypothetical protein